MFPLPRNPNPTSHMATSRVLDDAPLERMTRLEVVREGGPETGGRGPAHEPVDEHDRLDQPLRAPGVGGDGVLDEPAVRARERHVEIRHQSGPDGRAGVDDQPDAVLLGKPRDVAADADPTD